MDFLISLLRPKAALSVEQLIVQSGSAVSLAGIPVTQESALRISTVWACVRLISQSLASIPFITYRRRADGGRERADQHPLYDLLHGQPNNIMTSFEFKRLLTAHAVMLGNGYARIRPGPRGPVDKLIPIHPARVTVEQIDEDQLRYTVNQGVGKKPLVLLDDEMFHLRGPSVDGITGMSVIEYGRKSLGLALTTEDHGSTLFTQGASLGGVLTYKGKLTSKAAQAIRNDWDAQHAGPANAHSVAVFGDDLQYTQTSMSNEDAQFLATREFQVADVARWFGVDLTLIQENSKSTAWGTGIEQLIQATITFTLLPWARLWEEAVSRDLIIANKQYYAEYLLNSLVRGDLKTRVEAYKMMIDAGIKSRNEIRQLENDNPVEGLDGYDKPLNMGDAKQTDLPGARYSDAHYRRLLTQAAERTVRKEMVALGKAAKRCETPEAWAQAVNEFYETHAEYVAESLAMTRTRAELYVTVQELTLVSRGPDAVLSWLPERAGYLAQMAQEEHDAAG